MEYYLTFDDIIDDIQYLRNNTEKIGHCIKKYQDTLSVSSKKKSGCFYTDESIVKYILNSVFQDIDLTKNPYITILDPSCGCGFFLTEAYDILKNAYVRNIQDINKKYPQLNLNLDNIHEHILEHNLYGADSDNNAVKMASLGLMLKQAGSTKLPNIVCCDSIINWEDTLSELGCFWRKRFDIIVGNPPYIGHKKLSGDYRKELNNIYKNVFKDKADISFCFIKSSIDRLTEGGKLCFITSRYFIESPSGKALRMYVKNNCTIERIVDFYGIRIMKGISVDPIILTLKKYIVKTDNEIDVIKARKELKGIEENKVIDKLSEINSNYFKHFHVCQKNLRDDGWILRSQNDISIIEKIERKLSFRLSDICQSFQGIITGCDKAFIIDESTIEIFKIEKDIVKKWIKNSNIKKYKVDDSSLYIMYSDMIKDIEKYSGAISYISRQKDRLEKRRECQRGVRKWYELQWGRDNMLFESEKIVFPYKSPCSRFAIDKGSYGSADIYGMYIKQDFLDKTNYECIAGILNSKLFEFYFKSFGKKLGDNLYDYYPNTVMRLMFPLIKDEYITSKVRIIMNSKDNKELEAGMKDIDMHLYDMFEVTDREAQVIEEGCDE